MDSSPPPNSSKASSNNKNNYVWLSEKSWGRRIIEGIIQFSIISGTTISGATFGIIFGYIAGILSGNPLNLLPYAIFGAFECGEIGFNLGGFISNFMFHQSLEAQELENAYKFFELNPQSTDSELASVYKKSALIYHPDKSTGNHEAFCKLQKCYEIIRNARAEEDKKFGESVENEFDLAEDVDFEEYFKFDEDGFEIVENFEYLPLVPCL